VHYNSETVPGMVNDNVWTVAEGAGGTLYIGHVHHGFSILSLKERRIKNFTYNPNDPSSLPGDAVNCIYKDRSGNIWVGTNRGPALFNPETETFIRFNDGGRLSYRVYDIRQLDDNHLWLAMEFGGVAIMNLSQSLFSLPEDTRFTYITEGDDTYSLSHPSVRCIFQDSFKNVWLGVWGGGINFLSSEPTLFGHYEYSPDPNTAGSLNNKTASTVCTDAHGNLWVGTDGGGVNVFSADNRRTVYRNPDGRSGSNSVLSSLCDADGNLWFGLFNGGVNYYDARQRQFHYNYLPELANLDVRALYEDRQRMLWIGTGEGFYKSTPARRPVSMQRYTFGNNLIRALLRDSRGRLWVGTFGSGLGVGRDANDSLSDVRAFTVDGNFPSNTINALCEDRRGNVWVGTGEGLVCFPPADTLGTYTVYRRDAGLANTHIRAIVEDAGGNIWVSTNTGISCLPVGAQSFSNYGHRDNVPSGNFMSGSAARDGSGHIYFGSVNGLCYFNPATVLEQRPAPTPVITALTAYAPRSNTESDGYTPDLAAGQTIRLGYRQNSFSITFNIHNYALTDRVEYSYQLNGLDDLWYTVGEQNEVTFRNIPPGNYRFMVRTRIRNQAWSNRVTSLALSVVPPVWLSWWAKLCYVALFVIFFYLVFYAYKKKLGAEALYNLEKKNHEQEQELNAERLRFFTNITHELRTPLTLILGPLEDIQKSSTLTGKDAQKISVIHQSAIRLLNLINQILEFRKVETQNKKLCVSRSNLAAVVSEVGIKYRELNRKPDVTFELFIEQREMMLYFDREAVTIILDNLLSNAIKYTDRGTIALRAYYTERGGIRRVEMAISDTGYGIGAEALPHIFERYYQEGGATQASGTGIGLALVKNLVDLHQGEITVESQPGTGTTFRFSLPVDNTYPDALHDDSEPAAKPEKESDEAADVSPAGRPILLVVEDNADISRYIADAFADTFDVRTAANGAQGVEQAFADIPDIIVSDIMMPVMDGIALCRQLKEDVRTSHIPIILLTAKDSLHDKEAGYRTGADSYLTKPFSATLLRSRIDNLLDARRRLADHFAAGSTPRTNLDEKRAIVAEAISRIDREFLDKMNTLIEERLSNEGIDIGYLADKLCMSKSTLYRKMKALTGLSTNEYVRKVKMHYAERLLLEGRYNVSEVAFRVGINSVIYFRQCFKEEFGVLPSEYFKSR
jgi:signal transduction histidine kinase/ligand-binding sensor domain-containing protein/DNA-binding response OmpR family regulator